MKTLITDMPTGQSDIGNSLLCRWQLKLTRAHTYVCTCLCIYLYICIYTLIFAYRHVLVSTYTSILTGTSTSVYPESTHMSCQQCLSITNIHPHLHLSTHLNTHHALCCILQVLDWPWQPLPVHADGVCAWWWAVHLPEEPWPLLLSSCNLLLHRDRVCHRIPALQGDCVQGPKAWKHPSRSGRAHQTHWLWLLKEAGG